MQLHFKKYDVSYVQRGAHMNRIKRRQKSSLLEVIDKYSHNQDACINFFMQIRYPKGYYCEKCGCRHYWNSRNGRVQVCSNCRSKQSLLQGALFQWCKLLLFKMILGIYLFLSENKGLSAIQFSTDLNINYKRLFVTTNGFEVS